MNKIKIKLYFNIKKNKNKKQKQNIIKKVCQKNNQNIKLEVKKK